MSEPTYSPKTRITVGEVSGRYKRRPDYVEDADGVIERIHGPYRPPNGADPEFLYSVRFDSSDLWTDADSNQAVYIDLWESALSPVDRTKEQARERHRS